MPTDLYLIRHGESVPNVEPIVGGMRGDTGLTERGRKQAELLERRLRRQSLPADHLYVSTLPRALETGKYVSRALGLPTKQNEELQELRPGDADGLSLDEWRERFGGFDTLLAADPFREFASGGESWAQFVVRAGAALYDLVSRHPDEGVVAVCHGGVLEASFYLAFGLGAGTHVAFAPLNTSITHWRHHQDVSGRSQWTLVTFNDAAHLAGESLDDASGQAVPTLAEEH